MTYTDRTPSSKRIFEKAKKYIPGGAAYSIRYFKPYPFYIRKAKGSRVWDEDGNEYIDFWMDHFAAILGHGYEPIIQAAREQLDYGAQFGWCNGWEVKWAETVCKWFSADKVKPANSGTESNMYATRLAKAYTGRRSVGKIEGGWHGGYDGLHKSVSYPFDKPASMGLFDREDIVSLPYNDLEHLIKRADRHELACIVVEPMLGSAGCIPAKKEFLQGLREYCDKENIVLIFDEVITGFRHYGGMQKYYGIKPDLTTMGKTVGGQYFAGAGGFCGHSEIMNLLDQISKPSFWERSFQGGTYVGNALTMRAGYVTIKELTRKRDELYPYIYSLGEFCQKELNNILRENKFQGYVTGICSMFGLHFTDEEPINGETAERTKNRKIGQDMFQHLLNSKIAYLSPNSPHFNISGAHTQDDVEKLMSYIGIFLKSAKRE